MTTPAPGFDRSVGIDISASRRSGDLTWVATIVPARTAPELVSVVPARGLLGRARTPDAVFPALADWIGAQRHAVIGIDSPFGLPRALMSGADWMELVAGFPTRFVDPEAFRDICRRIAGGREWRRDCDREAKTPFAAYNLRLYRQTWWIVAGLLRPLVLSGCARVVPMQMPAPPLPVLLEACPASTLKRLGAYRPYKGSGADRHAGRLAIVRSLSREGLRIGAPYAITVTEDPGGDALDAVVAAWAAWRAARTPGAFLARSEADRLEARVYF